MSTKALADALGVSRCKQLVQLQSANSTVPAVSVPFDGHPNVSSATSAIVITTTTKQSRRRSTRCQPLTNTVMSAPAPRPPATIVSAPPDTRHYGQCTWCLRVISLTAAGLLRSHGPNCSGSGKPPVDGSVSSASTQRPK